MSGFTAEKRLYLQASVVNVTSVLDKIQEYKRCWLQNIKRMYRNKLLTVLKNYKPTGRRKEGRPIKGLLDV
jgi:hypothetical protein